MWREAWEGSPYRGVVADPDGLQERLVIQSPEVLADYGADAEILDDGRTVHVAYGDRVFFGVIARGDNEAPIAVNVFRRPKLKKKTGLAAEGAFDFSTRVPGKKSSEKNSKSAPLPKNLRSDLIGVVRNQSFKSGNWFVECEEVYEEFQLDVMVYQYEMPRGAGIGDAIVFKIKPPRPEAKHVDVIPGIRKATGEIAEAVLARGFRDGLRCFNCGGLHHARNCPEKSAKGKGKGKRKGNAVNKPPVMRMLGIVKKKAATGRHFILCQDISDVYGMDAQIPVEEIPEGLKIGDRISFDVDEPPEGHQGIPLARKVKRLAASTLKAAEDVGDGEEDEGEEIEETLEDDILEEPALEAEAEDNADVDGFAEEDVPDAESSWAEPPPRKKMKAAEETSEPESLQGWVAAQTKLFGHLAPLRKGWIRIRSKSTGSLSVDSPLTVL